MSELSRAAGESPELLRALIWLGAFYNNRGEIRRALELSERALALARRIGEPYPLLVSHTRCGVSLFDLGEFARAHEHLEQAIRLYDPDAHRPLASLWGQDWGLIARAFDAWVLWHLGYADRARRLSEETVALARKTNPYSLCPALLFAAGLYGPHHLREPERQRQLVEEGLAIASERGFVQYAGPARAQRGRCLGGTEGLEELRLGLAQNEVASSQTFSGTYRCYLAEAYGELGRTDEALAALDEAFASRGDVVWVDSLLHLVRGRLLLQGDPGAHADAEHCLREALEIARRQGSRGNELRVAIDLAHLLRDRERVEEAREILQPVHAAFTEGFDTADLRDAKALLDALS